MSLYQTASEHLPVLVQPEQPMLRFSYHYHYYADSLDRCPVPSELRVRLLSITKPTIRIRIPIKIIAMVLIIKSVRVYLFKGVKVLRHQGLRLAACGVRRVACGFVRSLALSLPPSSFANCQLPTAYFGVRRTACGLRLLLAPSHCHSLLLPLPTANCQLLNYGVNA